MKIMKIKLKIKIINKIKNNYQNIISIDDRSIDKKMDLCFFFYFSIILRPL